jgi:hypothetical protein
MWLVLGVGMISQLIPIPIDETVSERWFYFPMIGILGVLGIAAEVFFRTTSKLRGLYLIMIILLVPLSIRTVVRSLNWHDEMRLYFHDESVSVNSPTIENSIGFNYLQSGELDLAIEHLQKASIFTPTEVTLFDLGLAYDLKGEADIAKSFYKESVSHYIGNLSPYRFAAFLIDRQAFDAASDFLNSQLQHEPADLTLNYLKSILLYKLGRKDEALACINKLTDPAFLNDYYIKELKNAMSNGEDIDDLIKNDPVFNLRISNK